MDIAAQMGTRPEVLIVILIIVFAGLDAAIVFLRRRKKPVVPDISPVAAPADTGAVTTPGTIPQPPSAKSPLKSQSRFSKAVLGWIPLFHSKVKDAQVWEDALIRADLGPRLSRQVAQKISTAPADQEPLPILQSELAQLLAGAAATDQPWINTRRTQGRPWVCFVVGVNGVGKTTTLSKLAHFFSQQKISDQPVKVGVVAADTFRKAAIEQLERAIAPSGAEFYAQRRAGEGADEFSEGADPAAVVFDGLKKFSGKDIILVDTSGRLQNKVNLMEELKKMKRVATKAMEGAPQDIWLVVDATLGQNAIDQGRSFHEAVGLTGLIITKLDGLSRGGTVFQLYQELKVYIRFLGTGEKITDLETFEISSFIEELFDPVSSSS